MNRITHTSKHEPNSTITWEKIKASALLIAVEEMSYCILEAKHYGNSLYFLNIMIII